MTNAVLSTNNEMASLQQWSAAISQDLEQIAVLHDREADKALIDSLREVNFPHNLGLVLETSFEGNFKGVKDEALTPYQLFAKSLEALPENIDQQALDLLAVDYADIYLNHSLHASPFESVWLDEDHLIQQEPMFQIRKWYKRYGLETENWRIRSDDHLVLQLQFIAKLLDPESHLSENFSLQKRLQDATMFMDEHLLVWLSDFCNLVTQRCNTDFYASVAVLTDAYIQELRTILAEITEIKRPTAEEIEEKRRAMQPVVEEPISFVPGVAESW